MDAHQRKIDLQAPADLTYLLDNIKDTAQKKLDLHIPPSAAPEDGQEDAFRTTVENLVFQYIQHTIALALPSISINGLDASPSFLTPTPSSTDHSTTDPSAPVDPDDPNFEPYDPKLADQLRSLHAALEAETTRVAELRREAPAKAAQNYAEKLKLDVEKRQSEVEDARLRAREEGERRAAIVKVKLERAEKVAQIWEKTRAGLEGLGGVTEGVAKLERAERAAVEVERL
ncbi:MAG: hypothetical protein MMC23_006599 [Stictis urceolatum]|nr:hypothetical protein [Stictis urceolata]